MNDSFFGLKEKFFSQKKIYKSELLFIFGIIFKSNIVL